MLQYCKYLMHLPFNLLVDPLHSIQLLGESLDLNHVLKLKLSSYHVNLQVHLVEVAEALSVFISLVLLEALMQLPLLG